MLYLKIEEDEYVNQDKEDQRYDDEKQEEKKNLK